MSRSSYQYLHQNSRREQGAAIKLVETQQTQSYILDIQKSFFKSLICTRKSAFACSLKTKTKNKCRAVAMVGFGASCGLGFGAYIRDGHREMEEKSCQLA